MDAKQNKLTNKRIGKTLCFQLAPKTQYQHIHTQTHIKQTIGASYNGWRDAL